VLGRLSAVDCGDSHFFESIFLGRWLWFRWAGIFLPLTARRSSPRLPGQTWRHFDSPQPDFCQRFCFEQQSISLPPVAIFSFLAQCSSANAEHSVLLLISSRGSRPQTRYSFRCVDLQQHRFSSISLSQLQSSAMERRFRLCCDACR
jgi:hypothetical protein